MKEDIKILEEFIEAYKIAEEVLDGDVIQAIENLIARYKETKQELESVKEIYYTQKEIETNYIPKSKVQEKIEEYKRKMEKDVNYLSKDYFNYRHKIYALQELLEES